MLKWLHFSVITPDTVGFVYCLRKIQSALVKSARNRRRKADSKDRKVDSKDRHHSRALAS